MNERGVNIKTHIVDLDAECREVIRLIGRDWHAKKIGRSDQRKQKSPKIRYLQPGVNAVHRRISGVGDFPTGLVEARLRHTDGTKLSVYSKPGTLVNRRTCGSWP